MSGGPAAADDELLSRFVSGSDQDAFAELLRRHGPMVLGVGRRVLANDNDAEDVLQATFLLLARQATSIRRRESIGCWLHGVAHRLALKTRVQDARRRARERRAADLRRRETPAAVAWSELQALLDEVLRGLPEKYRWPLVLCCLEGKSQAEAAAQLRCPLGTLCSRLGRGRQLLRRRLNRRGLALSASALAIALEASAAAAALPGKLTAATTAAVAEHLAGKGAGTVRPPVAALVEQGLRTAPASRSLAALLLLLAIGLATGARVLTGPKEDQQRPPDNRSPPPEAARPHTDRLGDPLPVGAVARLGTVRLRDENRVRTGLVFTPDSKTLLSPGKDGVVRFWEVATGKELRRLRVQDQEIRCFALSPNGKVLAVPDNDGIALWNVDAGKKLRQLSIKGVQALAFAPDGKTLAVAGPDRIVSLWDVPGGKERLRLRGRGDGIDTLRFTPNGKTLVGAGPKGAISKAVISVWDVVGGQLLRTLQGRPGQTRCLAVSPDGKVLAAGGGIVDRPGTFESGLVLWDLATGRELRRLQGHEHEVESVAFSPDGKTLVSAAYRDIRFWDVPTGKELRRIEGSHYFSYFVTFSPDGQVLASSGSEPVIRLWKVATGKPLHEYPAHKGGLSTAAFSPDGRLVVTGSWDSNDPDIRVWDANTGEQRRLLRGHTVSIGRVLFAPDGKTIYSGSGDGTIRQWDVQTGKELRLLALRAKREYFKDQVKTMAFSADGKRLTSLSWDAQPQTRAVATWDLATGKRLIKRRLENWHSVPELAADAGTLADVCGLSVTLEEVATGKKRFRLQAPPGQENRLITSPVRFSPDGSMLAALSHVNARRGKGSEAYDLTLHLWELATGKEVLAVLVSAKVGSWYVCCFAPDSRTLAIACGDTIWVCDVATGKKLLVRRTPSLVTALAFSPDGGRLVTAHHDSTALVWDVSPATARRGPRPGKLDPKALDRLWTDLAGEDAIRAHAALWTLLAVPGQAVPLLRERLRPAPPADPRRLRKLLADLDSRTFSVRDSASRELTALLDQVRPALQAALKQPLSLEYRRRIEALLALPATTRSAESLRRNRALRVLEHVGTEEARLLLHRLAKGTPAARETQEGQAALDRLRTGGVSMSP
jgi:RNA polymerase sigma factor (sigma-70 family)